MGTAAPTTSTAAPTTSTEAPTTSTAALATTSLNNNTATTPTTAAPTNNTTTAPTTAAPTTTTLNSNTTAAPTTAAPTTTASTTASTTPATTTAAPTTAAPTTPTTTAVPELVKKEIEQASEYMGTLNEAFDNGNLQQNMLDMDAFSGVTEVKLVAELNVQKADVNTDTPTQLLGTCQLSGLRLSDFQDAQRDASKSAMAASSGAMKEHVSIRNVFAKSSRRRLRVTTSQA